MIDEEKNIMVSVAIPVYNHALFVERAVESVLMQKTNFKFEIIIGDDFSTDGTREILIALKEKNPYKIQLLLADKNNGVHTNAVNIYNNCKGKYIAMLEGDDYWTYEHKLQKQVDFLENNPDYNGCFHDASIITTPAQNSNTIALKQSYSEYKYYSQFNTYKKDFYPWDLLQRNLIANATLVFRNADFLPFFMNNKHLLLSLNWGIHLYVIRNSKFRYFNETWSVYNDHPEGVTKKTEAIAFHVSNIKILKKFKKDSFYNSIRLDIQRATLNELKQILYNNFTKNKKTVFFIKYFSLFIAYTIRLFISESFYFLKLRFK